MPDNQVKNVIGFLLFYCDYYHCYIIDRLTKKNNNIKRDRLIVEKQGEKGNR